MGSTAYDFEHALDDIVCVLVLHQHLEGGGALGLRAKDLLHNHVTLRL